jgi:predicted  nucleic acid-binding Zn-ribbon protein
VDAPVLARYEQLLKQRRGLAVARMTGEMCAACHVRLRPHIAQIVRRNDEILACESCQRILYFVDPAPGS